MHADNLEGTFTPHPGNFTVVLGENVTFYSTFSNTFPELELSWIVTLASGTRYQSSSPGEAKKIRQLGIFFNDTENSLTIPARMDMNNTMVIRYATDAFASAFSYQGNLKVLG